jgi:hypothetical protein
MDLCWHWSRDISGNGHIRRDEILDGSVFEASNLADFLPGGGCAQLPGVPVWNDSRCFYI